MTIVDIVEIANYLIWCESNPHGNIRYETCHFTQASKLGWKGCLMEMTQRFKDGNDDEKRFAGLCDTYIFHNLKEESDECHDHEFFINFLRKLT